MTTDYSRAIKKLPLIKADHGIHLLALVDIDGDEFGPARKAGDEWQLKGPLTYIPSPDVVCVFGIISIRAWNEML